MAFVFPPAPALGDAYASGGVSWVWNGIYWEYGTGLLIPFITALIPSEVATNIAGTVVRVVGGNFVPTSEVWFDGAAIATTYVGSTELTFTAPSRALAAVVSVDVRQGAVTSGPKEFTYVQPQPFINALQPNASPTGQTTPVKVIGGNYTAQSKVIFGGTELPTTFVNAGELGFTAPNRSAADAVNVTVIDGALTSNTAIFNYMLKTIWLDSIVPNAVDNMAGQTRVDFNGRGFTSNLQIVFGTTMLSPFNFTSANNGWTWLFPNTWNMGNPANPGTVQVYLWNGTTGESSNSLPFTFT
jgi:hypothetical protein